MLWIDGIVMACSIDLAIAMAGSIDLWHEQPSRGVWEPWPCLVLPSVDVATGQQSGISFGGTMWLLVRRSVEANVLGACLLACACSYVH